MYDSLTSHCLCVGFIQVFWFPPTIQTMHDWIGCWSFSLDWKRPYIKTLFFYLGNEEEADDDVVICISPYRSFSNECNRGKPRVSRFISSDQQGWVLSGSTKQLV